MGHMPGSSVRFAVLSTAHSKPRYSVFLKKKTPADRNTSRELEPSNFRQSPEAVLIDFRRPNLRFQRGPRDAQLGRSPLGSEYPAATFFQGGLNHVLLLLLESSREINLVFRFCC